MEEKPQYERPHELNGLHYSVNQSRNLKEIKDFILVVQNNSLFATQKNSISTRIPVCVQ